jgi:Na+/H+ antiporter NhaD/arsenite permease-like protein
LSELIPIAVLAAVFVLIAVRKIGGIRLCIWQIVTLGAVAVLVTGQISPTDALASINPDVMLFLFGMFVVGVALAESGYLYHLSYRLFSAARSVDHLVLAILIATGLLSALLMNDTLAVVGTPLMLYFARRYGISSSLLLLSLAFAVTTGSVASPIGNPQNLLIALSGGVENPFFTFAFYLVIPTLISLLLAYGSLRLAFRDEFHATPLVHMREEIRDPALASLARLSLILLVLLIAIKIAVVILATGVDIGLTYIALVAALPILVGSRRRLEVIRKVDWETLVFFASLFVLMASVWQSEFFQPLIAEAPVDLTAVPVIVVTGVVLSQFVSNVPFVALYLPALSALGTSTTGLMALAAGSTIAGNMLVLGAASNIIIIQNAEKSGATLTFWEFARIGVPLTVAQTAVYVVFLSLFPA